MITVDSRPIVGEYVFLSKYSQTRNGFKETWHQAVNRVMDMHIKYYRNRVSEQDMPEFLSYFGKAYDLYHDQRILGAQRALQYGGELMTEKVARFYNCTMTHCDRVRFFEEAMYLLLCGCGVGYSVQHRHTEKLPVPKGFDKDVEPEVFQAPDTIEGWAACVGKLMTNYYEGGAEVEFDLSLIRPKGAPIRGGFRAPGPEPLRAALQKIRGFIGRIKNRKLTPFELHYVTCIFADSVVTGGVRRSAMIALFDAWDMEMAQCKTGNWISEKKELCRANNSAVILPGTDKETFDTIFEFTKKYGEPGFVFLDDPDFSVNPCFTGNTLIAVADGRNAVSIKELAEEGKEFTVYSAHFAENIRGNHWKAEIKRAKAFPTGIKKTVKVTLSNGDCFTCTEDHRLALFGKEEYVEARNACGEIIEKFFTVNNKYRTICANSNGYAKQYRMIWEFANGVKPDGFDIDHIENGKGDFLSNLHLLSTSEHQAKTARERVGENNPIHRLKNPETYSHNLSLATTLENNPRYKGLTNTQLYEIAKQCHEMGETITCKNCRKIDERFPRNFSKNRFGGKIANLRNMILAGEEYVEAKDDRQYIAKEKHRNTSEGLTVVSVEPCGEEMVYDLTVEDNHNFYIITHGDENYENCEGVLVHNCGEVTTLPIFEDETGRHTGWGFCNLAEINGGKVKTKEEFYEACEAAAVICTLQAGYTNFKVLERWSQKIAERDALIGVGITGFCEHPDILFDPEVQRTGARIVKKTNKAVAKLIGINAAARCTVVKPSGNSSQLLGTLSGISLGHSYHYIRHIQAADTEQALHEWEKINPECVEVSAWNPDREKVLAFPVTLPENALVRENVTAIEFLQYVLLTKNNWIEEGTNFAHPESVKYPKLRMNVSNTCTVKENEWDGVREFLWSNRDQFGGVSLLSYYGDLDYPQAPFTQVLDENQLAARYGAGAILSSGLVVDSKDIFRDVWEACNAAMGFAPNLLQLTDKEISDFITKHIQDGKFLVKIDGVCFSDVNCVIDHLRHKVEQRLDWVRRFNSFAEKYMGGDRQLTSYCLKHVNAYHKWQHICRMRKVDYNGIVWEEVTKEAGSEIATACAGGACEYVAPQK